jgi:hypothetical protein
VSRRRVAQKGNNNRDAENVSFAAQGKMKQGLDLGLWVVVVFVDVGNLQKCPYSRKIFKNCPYSENLKDCPCSENFQECACFKFHAMAEKNMIKMLGHASRLLQPCGKRGALGGPVGPTARARKWWEVKKPYVFVKHVFEA